MIYAVNFRIRDIKTKEYFYHYENALKSFRKAIISYTKKDIKDITDGASRNFTEIMREKRFDSPNWTAWIEEIEMEDVFGDEPIEFILYDASPHMLCNGTLVLKIDGKRVVFNGSNSSYGKFWVTGGRTNYRKNEVIQKPWELDEDDLPDEYKHLGHKLIDVFNDNVPWGCCGGCM